MLSEFADAKAYARSYVGQTSEARFFNARLREVFQLLEEAKGGKLLDVGCGPGILLSKLAGTRFEPHGLDLSPSMIAEARAASPAHAGNFTVGRAESLPYRENYFDVVLALGMLEYVPKPEQVLAELHRVAKPGSLIVVSMLNPRSLRHIWEETIYRVVSAIHRRLTRAAPAGAWLHRLPDRYSPMRLLSRRSLRKLMDACDLHAERTIYYDLNVVPIPFDARHPRTTFALDSWLERHLGQVLKSVVHTGYLVVARK